MSDLSALGTPDAFSGLAAVLRDWVPQQRWFAGKARELADVQLHDAVLLTAPDETDLVLEVIVEVTYYDAPAQLYQVPLAAGSADDEGAVGEVGGVYLVDATFVPSAARLLTALTQQPMERRTARGDVIFGAGLDDEPVPLDNPRRMSAEQSNTSIVLGDAVIYKMFRRLEPGENPEIEITRALTEAGFENAPRQRGSSGVRHPDGSVTALGVIADFVKGGREGWAIATAEVARIVAGATPDSELAERMGDLGRAIADMHGALARTLGSREATPGDLIGWVEAMQRQLELVLMIAERHAPDAAAPVLQSREVLFERIARVAEDKATGPLTRIHGDLHLGQVLVDARGRWQLLDFEGEPAKSLSERRALNAPLRDVAGMLRSFDYAAASGSGGDLAEVPQTAARWRDQTRERFLQAYLEEAARLDVLPHDEAAITAQLDAFELDKAVYELGYELANRPHWVGIPVGGIARVLDRAAP